MGRRIFTVCVVCWCAVSALLASPARAAAAETPLIELHGREGFWRIGRDGTGVWWFVSPDGRREFLNCVTTVQPRLVGRDLRGPDYTSRDFTAASTLGHWAQAAASRVASSGFKGIGAWSNPALHGCDLPMTRDLNVTAWLGGGAPPVGSPAWRAGIEEAIRRQVLPLRDNRNLVGYYLDNELDWGGGDDDATYHTARRYFEETTNVLRRYDPNHLILGVRFRGAAPAAVMRASKGFTDAQSINYYPQDAKLDHAMFTSLHELSGGQPVIVSEYSFHSLDGRSGNRNHFGFPAQVANQRARADGYRLMTTRLARLPYVIGADWFQWMDEPPSGRRRDGEDANFGVVDVKDEPYELLVDAVRATAPQLNPLHSRSTRDSYADVWRGPKESVAGVGTE